MKRTLLLVVAFAISINFISHAQSSLNFDGVDDGTGSYVDIGAFSLTSYTKEAWIKWDGTLNLQHNILSGSINGSQHAFWIVGDKLRSGHSGDYLGASDPGTILSNTWYHCAVTYDGTTGEMKLYRDGALVAFDIQATGFVLEKSYIGAFGNSSDELVAVMAGDIDDARVWNYVRTQAEIQADMNSCLDGTETGLTAFYHFEDDTGSTTLTDATGNGYDGTLVNMDPATDWVTGQGVCEIIPPEFTFSTAETSPTNASPIQVDISWTEPVGGFSINDLIVGNGTKSNFVKSGLTATVDITPITDGLVTVDMGAGGASDAAGNGNLPATQLSIEYDGTSPTASPVVIASNNADPSLAAVGDEVVISFTTSETLLADPVVTIASNTATIGGGPLAWTATYTMQSGDTEGTVSFTVDFTDAVGNAATQVVATTDASSVTFDETAPTASPVSIASNNTNTGLATSGDVVTLSFTTSENLVADPVVTIDGNTATISGGPLAWTAAYTMQTGDTEGVVAFTIDFTDTVGNAATQVIATSDGSSVTFDETAPTASPVSIASNNTDPSLAIVGDVVTLSFTTSETLIADPVVTIDGNTATISGGPLAWTAAYTMQSGDAGVATFTIDFTDASGNAATQVIATSDGSSVTFDETAPTADPVSIASNNTDSSLATVGDIVTLSFTTSETLIADPVVTIDGNTATISGGPLAWTAAYTMQTGDTEGVVAFTIDFTDASGNMATQVVATSDASSVSFDETSPTVAIISAETSPTNASPILVTLTFSEDVTGFDASDLSIGNGTAGTFTAVSATEYTVEVSPTADGAVTVDVAADAGADASGNGNEAATQFSIDYDGTSPTASPVSIASNNTNTGLATSGDVVTLSFTTSENLVADPVVTIDGNTATISGGPLAWTAAYTMQTGDTEGVVAFTIDFTDTVGNAATQVIATSDGSSVTFDETAPTASPVSIASNNTDPSLAIVGDVVTLSFTTSETLIADPVVTIDGNTATISGGPLAWTAAYTMQSGDAGVATFTIDFTDASGNAATQVIATSDGSSVTFDETAPTADPVSIASNNTDSSLATVGDIVTLSFTTSETLIADPVVTIDGNTATISGGPLAWTAAYTMQTGDTEGVVAFTIDFTDASGNMATQVVATSDASSVSFDETSPTVAIISAETSPTNASPILVTLTFSEDVTGFDASDLSIGNGTAGTFTAVSATEYTVEVSPTADGAVTVDVAADAGADASGNGNEAATQFSIDYDGTDPTVAITSAETSPTNASPILVTLTFSEDVTGFDASDLSIGNGTAGTFTAVSATEYTVEVLPTADGAVTVDVAADAGADAAGNGNEAATQFSIDYDGTDPTVAITSLETSPTNASPILVTLTFSEDVTGFDASDLSIGNGTAGTFTAVSATEYTVEVSPTTDGAVTVDVAADAGADASGNGNEAATQFSIDYDGTDPTVAITSLETSPTNASPILVTLTFSEDVTGFDASDLSIGNGTAGTFTVVSATEYTVEVLPTADGAVTVDVAADAGADASGNGNEAATQFSIDYDGTDPTVAITSAETSPTNASQILVTLTFSEDVTGFDAGDLSIGNGAAGTFTAVSATEYTVEVLPTADGAVTVDVAADAGADASGNGNEAATQFSIDYDGTDPTVAITSLETSPTNASPILVTLTFSEDVTGFDASDLSIGNGTAGTFTAVSATEYTVEVSPTTDGAVTVDVAADAGADASGNGNEAATQFSIDYDGTDPTVAITSLETSPTNASPILVTLTFSEDVTGFDASDLSIGNGTAGTFTAVSATEYTVEVSPTADGAVTVDVAADAGADASGNGNEAATQFSIDYDGTDPTVAITSAETSPTNASPILVTLTFSEDVTGFDASDLSIGNGTAGTFTAVSATEYTVEVSPTADGAVTVDVAADAGADASGNGNEAATQFSIDYDGTDPTVAITSLETSPTNTSPFFVNVTFSEDVTGFDASDLSIGNGTASGFIGSEDQYLVAITPTADGAVTVDVAADAGADASGNGNEAATQFSIDYDGTNPTVAITSAETSPTNASPILVTLTFSEDVTGFDASDLSIGNGTAGTFTAVSATEYTVEVSPTADGAVTVDVAADAGADASGNGNEAATQFSIDYDGTDPTVAITSAETSPTNASPILVTLTFSEDVTGFDASDLSIGNGAAGTFTAVSATEYTVEVSPTADGAVTVDVAADAGADASGNGNEAATQFSIDYDGTDPTVAITSAETSPTNASQILVTLTFSEDVTGFDAGDLSIGNGAAGTFTAVSATEYTVEVLPTADGAVTVDVAADAGEDASGNGNEAATQFSIDYDGTDPTVAITSAETSPTNASPILVTLTFSEDVTGFDASDLSIGNGTAGTFTAVSATEYTVEVSPTTDGAVTVDVAADAGADASGNGNEAATQFSIDYDGTDPTVAITSEEGSSTNDTTFIVMITFSEDVTGFDASDLSIGNGTAGTFTSVSATEYTVEVSPTTDGAVTVDVAADAGADASGNGNEAATQFSIDYDGTDPTVAITSEEGSSTNDTTFIVMITFSEDVTGFDASDLSIGNGAAGTFTAVSATEYTVEVSPTTDGAVTVDVAADAGEDAAGNGNEAATQFSIDYDGTDPTVAITSLETSPTNTSPILVTLTFSEEVILFNSSDLVIGNGTAGTFTAVSATEYTVEVLPTADGAVTVDVAADAGEDVAGNGNEAAEQFSINYDGTDPTVDITSTESSPTNESPFSVTITFSEAVTGFDVSDLLIGNGSVTFFGGSGTTYIAAITPSSDGTVTVDIPADSAIDTTTNGNAAATQFSIEYDGSLKLSAKVFLQGPLLNPATPGLMNDILREDALLPTTSPYTDALTVDPNVFNSGGLSGTGLAADDIVDWIWVELRDSGDNKNVIAAQSALLQRDGDVVGLDGTSEVSISAAATDYYIVIQHRNHMGAMSQSTFVLTASSATMVDFTDSGFLTFGTDAQVILESGDKALWAGNTSGDGIVRYLGPDNDTNTIKDAVLAQPGNSSSSNFFPYTGYDNSDIDMNGTIRYLGPGNDTNIIKDIILSHPGNSVQSNFFPIIEQTPN